MKASRMKILRVTAGKRQTDLGKDARIGQYKISLIERGLPPTQDEAARIAKALGVKPEEIFLAPGFITTNAFETPNDEWQGGSRNE
ncbi:MAG: helix-turn-helix transcriptional regulator [Desulfosarcina sp.]|nr:helix-turn-helix transcriptional regulator [Desulfosarcina sp.]MBC2744147.1 helix-turn-helix transcriptional regulator [Desulfosarcina sp.]MBC2767056.1 helix-turn-helix transcriptional regulator [Desulfosarcina sp.]